MNKLKIFLIWVILPLFVLIFYWKIKGSNSVPITIKDCKNGSVETMQELNKLVKQNFLDQEFYEVYAFTDFGPCFLANYNKKYRVLLMATDPTSGWSGFYKVTPQQLQKITDQKFSADDFYGRLKTLPDSMFHNFPSDYL